MGKDEEEAEWKQFGWEAADDRTLIKAVTNKCCVAH